MNTPLMLWAWAVLMKPNYVRGGKRSELERDFTPQHAVTSCWRRERGWSVFEQASAASALAYITYERCFVFLEMRHIQVETFGSTRSC